MLIEVMVLCIYKHKWAFIKRSIYSCAAKSSLTWAVADASVGKLAGIRELEEPIELYPQVLGVS